MQNDINSLVVPCMFCLFFLHVFEKSNLEVLNFGVFSELDMLDWFWTWQIKHARVSRYTYFNSSLYIFLSYTTLILRGSVLNRVPGTQSCIEYLKMILEKPQSMTEKCHTVRHLNRLRQHIM